MYSPGECYGVRGRPILAPGADSVARELYNASESGPESGFETDFDRLERPAGFLTRRVASAASITLVPGVQGKNHRPRRCSHGPGSAPRAGRRHARAGATRGVGVSRA